MSVLDQVFPVRMEGGRRNRASFVSLDLVRARALSRRWWWIGSARVAGPVDAARSPQCRFLVSDAPFRRSLTRLAYQA